MGIFDRPIEELEQVGATWQPHNDDDEAAATAAMELPGQLPDVLQAAANMTKGLAAQIDAEVPFASGARDLFHELGAYITEAIVPIRDAAAGIRALHQSDFDRLDDPDVRQDAWDRVRNRGR